MAWEELKEVYDRAEDFGSLPPSMSASRDPARDESGDPFAASDDEASLPRRRPRPGTVKQRLRFEPDFRLLLYKHWSLEESMMHSPYFYGTLELHRDKGLRALKNFFVTAGIASSDYKQTYRCMQMPVRKNLRRKFIDHGK